MSHDSLSLEAWLSALEGTSSQIDDARYILGCRECRNAWTYQRDSKTVKATRNGERYCPECQESLELIQDAKAPDQRGKP